MRLERPGRVGKQEGEWTCVRGTVVPMLERLSGLERAGRESDIGDPPSADRYTVM
jgi:hypothetical protein